MGFAQYLTPEEAAQAAVVNYLRLKYPDVLFYHSPQETFTKSKFQRWKNKVLGVRAGVPDLLIFRYYFSSNDDLGEIDDEYIAQMYYGLAIEMKHGKGKPTPAQNDFMNALENNGWRCEVCYDSEEAMHVIDEYLGRKELKQK